jgi:hypothetical protein
MQRLVDTGPMHGDCGLDAEQIVKLFTSSNLAHGGRVSARLRRRSIATRIVWSTDLGLSRGVLLPAHSRFSSTCASAWWRRLVRA